MDQIEALFSPKSVAIVGTSRTTGKWGFTFLRHLIHGGYRGKIFPVNPAGGSFQALRAFRNIDEIEERVDLAYILIPPDKVLAAVQQCARKGVRACVVITAGFKELGEEGRALEARMAAEAARAGMALVGPNCAGVASPEPMSLYCMMMPTFPRAGGIAVVSQSGNLAGSIQRMLWKQDIGVSRVVSTGNQAMLTAEDFFDYLAADPLTRVVIAYLEAVADGERFMESVRRLTRQKPLLLIKGGRSQTGVQAARSHTGAIAGSYRVFDGACRQAGAILVSDLEEMLDTAVAFLSQPLPAGNRVGVVSNGGGWGVLSADDCLDAGLQVVQLPEQTLAALDCRLPPWWNRANPVDTVAGVSRGAYFKAVEILAACEQIDGVLALGFGYGKSTTEALAALSEEQLPGVGQWIADALHSDHRGKDFLLKVIREQNKPVLLSSEFAVGADRDGNQPVLRLREQNVLIYPTPGRAARVLSRMARYHDYLQRT